MPPVDRDGDYEYHKAPRSYYDPDDYDTRYYPQKAGRAEAHAITALIKRYFAAAAAEDGAGACMLIYSLLAETIPETYGQPSSEIQGTTCPEVMTKLFKSRHRQLAAENATLQITRIQLSYNRGRALLRFKGIPAHSIEVHRERGRWKINAVVDSAVS